MARGFDGTSWGQLTELTDPSNPQDNMGQEMVEYDGRLYVVWVSGTNTSEESSNTISVYNTFGHVVIRAYDGYGWSDLMELTPIGKTDNANAPTLAAFGGRLYAAWAYPTQASNGGKETWDIIARNIDFHPVEMSVTLGGSGLADWGPSEVRSTSDRVPLDAAALASAMESVPRQEDRYGNEYCDVPIRLLSANPSLVTVGNLSIVYSLTVRFENLTTVLNGLLRAKAGAGRDASENTTLPLSLEAASTGRLRMHELNLTYIIDLPPVLVLDIPDLHFKEDTVAVHLIDLDRHFWDDWDAGNLDYVVTLEQDAARIHAIVDGHYLTFSLPTKYWHGTESFRVRAYDRARLWADSNIFNITVDHVNHPPVLDPMPARTVDVGTRVYFLVHATDPDNDTLSFYSNNTLVPALPLAGRLGTAYVAFTPDRMGTLLLNITVDDGNGGNDTKTARILAVEGVSSAMNDLCPTWLVIIAIAAAAVGAAEYYRRRYLRETGPVIGPGGEFTEEQVFGGLVTAATFGAPVQGGSERDDPARAQVAADGMSPAKKDLEARRKAVEDAIQIPGQDELGTGNR